MPLEGVDADGRRCGLVAVRWAASPGGSVGQMTSGKDDQCGASADSRQTTSRQAMGSQNGVRPSARHSEGHPVVKQETLYLLNVLPTGVLLPRLTVTISLCCLPLAVLMCYTCCAAINILRGAVLCYMRCPVLLLLLCWSFALPDAGRMHDAETRESRRKVTPLCALMLTQGRTVVEGKIEHAPGARRPCAAGRRV